MDIICNMNIDVVLRILGWAWNHDHIQNPIVFPHSSNCLKLRNHHDLQTTSRRTLQAFCFATITALCTYVGVPGYDPEYMHARMVCMKPKKGTPSWLQWAQQLASNEAMNIGAWWVFKGRCIRNTQHLKWVPALVIGRDGDKYICALFVDQFGKAYKPKEGCGLSILIRRDNILCIQHSIPVDLMDARVELWFNPCAVDSETKAALNALCHEHGKLCNTTSITANLTPSHAFVQKQDSLVAQTTCQLSMVNKSMYELLGFCMSKYTSVQRWWMHLSANGSCVKASTTTTSIYSNLSGCRKWSQLQAWRHANETRVYLPICTFMYYDKCVRKLDNNAMIGNFVYHQAHSCKKRKRDYNDLQSHFIYLRAHTHYPLNKSNEKLDANNIFQLIVFYLKKALAVTKDMEICKVFDLEKPATNLEVEIIAWFNRLMFNDIARSHQFSLVAVKHGKMVQLCDANGVMQHMLMMYKMHIASAMHQSGQHISAFGPYLGRHAILRHDR